MKKGFDRIFTGFEDKKFLIIILAILVIIVYGISQLSQNSREIPEIEEDMETAKERIQEEIEAEIIEPKSAELEPIDLEEFCNEVVGFQENFVEYEKNYNINGKQGTAFWRSTQDPENYDILNLPDSFFVVSDKFQGCGTKNFIELEFGNEVLTELQQFNYNEYECPDRTLYTDHKNEGFYDTNIFVHFTSDEIMMTIIYSLPEYSEFDLSETGCNF